LDVRAIVLALVAAVAIAALLAAGWLGLALAAATGESEPAPAGRAARDTPRPARHVRRRAPAWADRATQVCGRAHEQTLDLIDNLVLDSPQLSQRQRGIAYVTRAVRIEARTLAALKALRPRPRADRRAINRTLRLFEREVAADRALATTVRRRWNPALLARRRAEGRAANARLELLFFGLGAGGCATYLDPQSY
jgi:hypothetical protein